MFTIEASTKSIKATAHSKTSVSFPRRVDRNDGRWVKVLVIARPSLCKGDVRVAARRS